MIVPRASLFRRLFLVGIAIAQMAAPALVAAADGALAAQSSMVAGQTHIEDHTGAGCRPAHPDNCALCQFLTHFAATRTPAPLFVVAERERFPRGVDEHHRSIFASAVERSRAPPVG